MSEGDQASLGTCCVCGGTNHVRTIFQLDKKSPTPGCGWGCVVCGLPPDGAVAVVCDECFAVISVERSTGIPMKKSAELQFACKGFPETGGRVPISELVGDHRHDMSKHPEAVSDRECRVCGCTDSQPCVTATGPCSWVEEDLCSACATKERIGALIAGPKGLHLTEEDVEALEDLPIAQVRIPPHECFQLLSALQLALRHPAMPDSIRITIVRIAGTLQQHIAVTENLQAICEAGWDPSCDVPAERRIIAP
jgi:hypothetical protein